MSNINVDSAVPITALTPFAAQNCVIRARVSEKGDVRNFKKKADNSDGKLFSCVLNDENSSIRATFFNEGVDNWYSIINNGEVYYFSGFSVKTANKQFNNTNNDYELTMDTRCSVRRCNNDISIPSERFNFSLISVLPQKFKNSNVDILAVVMDPGHTENIESKAKGTTYVKRTAILGEPSGFSIECAFFGDDCQAADQWQAGNVVAIKGLRVSDWNTCSLTWGKSSSATINPRTMSDVTRYSSWYNNGGANANLTSHSKRRELTGAGANQDDNQLDKNKYRFFGRQYLSVVETEQLGQTADKMDFFDAVVFVSRFGKASDNAYWYISCPKCMKKVTPNNASETEFSCTKCGTTLPEKDTIPRYIFQAEVNDRVSSKWVTFFDDAGVKFFGKDARTLRAEMMADTTANALGSQSPNGGGAAAAGGGAEDDVDATGRPSADIGKMLNKYLHNPFLAKFRCSFEPAFTRSESNELVPGEHRTKVVVSDCEPVKKDKDRPVQISPKYLELKNQERKLQIQQQNGVEEDGEQAEDAAMNPNWMILDEIDGMLKLLQEEY
jgi:replication factor A1